VKDLSVGVAVVESQASEALLDLMQGFYEREGSYCFRREMFHAMRAALQIKCARSSCCDTLVHQPHNIVSYEAMNGPMAVRHGGDAVQKKSEW